MGRMNVGPDRFWSDGTQDAVDEHLEKKYHVTEKFLDQVDAGDPKAVLKAREIYRKAKVDPDAWDAFCEEAEYYEDYRPKKKVFFYALETGLLLPDSPGPLTLAIIESEKRKSAKKPKKAAKKPVKRK